MTKKELLENKYFEAMPDDTELVFRTCSNTAMCRPIISEDIAFESGLYEIESPLGDRFEHHSYMILNVPSFNELLGGQ